MQTLSSYDLWLLPIDSEEPTAEELAQRAAEQSEKPEAPRGVWIEGGDLEF